MGAGRDASAPSDSGPLRLITQTKLTKAHDGL